MARQITAAYQNTIALTAGEITELMFDSFHSLEMLNMPGGGTVWMKWHGDFIPEVNGDTSSPIPPGFAYVRERAPRPNGVVSSGMRIAFIADAATTLVVNVI